MKVLLVDFDSKLPNLALMKLSAWHKLQGDEVGFHVEDPDKIYVSVVFKKNKQFAGGIPLLYPNAEVVYGGSGWDLHKDLPDEIEYIKPDYELYNGMVCERCLNLIEYCKCKMGPIKGDMNYSTGFTTRGCIRNCYFCIVPEKEGMIRINQHPREFWDPSHKKLIMYDNNILALKKWFFEITDWIIEKDLIVDFNQGLDIRLLTPDMAERLNEMRSTHTWKFAFDDMSLKDEVIRGINILKEAGIDTKNHTSFYVYCHDDSMYQDTLDRCNILRENRTCSFVMFNIDKKKSKRITKLQRWANRRWAYWAGGFDPRRSF